ncbi:hypothetical protein EC973_005017 [Apophysomyces ossiformis]|uniref:DDB1- and CUL4-associated factor 12 beta-propeller domain-containing protein n=1 Tax=Apophysomyces ossiformis TaxID=679940 RepID=A0A8H7EM63_9FUNG|nr:hypothetical protein EC973_005017 [Apophysomyces ossiformis]
MTERTLHFEEQDKVFASVWLSSTQILMGTKESKLFLVDLTHGQTFNIPLNDWGHQEGHRSTPDAHPMRAPRSSAKSQISAESRDPLTPTMSVSTRYAALGRCQGIRCLTMNPSKTLLAVAMADPAVTMVYSLPSLELYTVCKGHRDAVYSATWVTDTQLMTGSRDGTLSLWKMKMEEKEETMETQASPVRLWTSPKTGNIRDLRFTGQQTASLLSNGYMKLWDPHTLKETDTVRLPHTCELVCLSHQRQRGLFAVGSAAHVTLLDPRLSDRKVVADLDSIDGNWGVRSLDFSDTILACGSGHGKLSFVDIRNMKYLPLGSKDKLYHSTTHGWLDRQNRTYQNFCVDTSVPPAIYTMAFSPDRTRLFTAGGPIQVGLRGCYAAVWK